MIWVCQQVAAAAVPVDAGGAADEAALAALGRPILEVMERLVGAEGALAAARTFVAWAHGFTSLELAGGFRLGGDLDEAYTSGIELILAGLSVPAPRARR